MEKNLTTDETSYLYKSLNGQINIDEAKGVVEAFVAGIGNKDSVNDICLPGCFTNSLARRKPRVVWGHDWNSPIGKVLEIYEVGPNDPRLPTKMKKAGIGGLYVKVQFNLKAEKGKEAFANVSFFGLEQEWSIGYKTLDAVFDPVQNANLLKEVELYEVSPVLHGANQLTGTISIKADSMDTETKEKGAKKPVLRDPKGGLTAAGRAHFKRTEGANLKPGVKGPADTPEKMRRKGSFLTRFFTNPRGPMKKPNGKPTRLALSAAAWGEPVPQNASDAAALAAKGRRLLERYQNTKKKSDETETQNKNHVDAIYAAYSSQSNESFGRASMLTRALARHFGGAVRLIKADNDIAIFEMGAGTGTEMLRVAYHFDGDEFMFGTAQKVKPETVFIPVGTEGSPTGGVATAPSEEKPHSPMISAGVPSASCCDDCAKGKNVCSAPKSLASWEEFLTKNNGHHSMIIPELGDDPQTIFSALSAVGEYHGFSVKTLTEGFLIENYDSLSEEAVEAIATINEAMEQKALRKLRRSVPTSRMDPRTAIDADLDRLVLEGVPTINAGRGVPDPTPFGNVPNVPSVGKKPKPRNRAERVYDRTTERVAREMERAADSMGRVIGDYIDERRRRRAEKFRKRGWLPTEEQITKRQSAEDALFELDNEEDLLIAREYGRRNRLGIPQMSREDTERMLDRFIPDRRERRRALYDELYGDSGAMRSEMPAVPRPQRQPDELPEKKPEKQPERTPKEVPERVPEKVPEKQPEKVPAKPERVPEKVPAKPQRVPEKIPTRPQTVPTRPTRQPERVPARPVRQPERVPVRREASMVPDSGAMTDQEKNEYMLGQIGDDLLKYGVAVPSTYTTVNGRISPNQIKEAIKLVAREAYSDFTKHTDRINDAVRRGANSETVLTHRVLQARALMLMEWADSMSRRPLGRTPNYLSLQDAVDIGLIPSWNKYKKVVEDARVAREARLGLTQMDVADSGAMTSQDDDGDRIALEAQMLPDVLRRIQNSMQRPSPVEDGRPKADERIEDLERDALLALENNFPGSIRRRMTRLEEIIAEKRGTMDSDSAEREALNYLSGASESAERIPGEAGREGGYIFNSGGEIIGTYDESSNAGLPGDSGSMTFNRPVPQSVRDVVQGTDMSNLIGGREVPMRRSREALIAAANRAVRPESSRDPMDPASRAAEQIIKAFDQAKLSPREIDDHLAQIKRVMDNMVGEVGNEERRNQIIKTFSEIMDKLTPEQIAFERSKIRSRIRNAGFDEMRRMFGLDDDSDSGAMARRAARTPEQMERAEKEDLGRKIWLERTYDGKTLDDVARKHRMTREAARQLELMHANKLRGMDLASDNRVGRRSVDAATNLSEQEMDLLRRRFDGELLEESARRLRMDRVAVRRMEQLALRKIRDSIVSGSGQSGAMGRRAGGEAEDANRPKGRKTPARKRRPIPGPTLSEIIESLRDTSGDDMSRTDIIKAATLMRIKRAMSDKIDELLTRGAREKRLSQVSRFSELAQEIQKADKVYESGWTDNYSMVVSVFGSLKDLRSSVMRRGNRIDDAKDIDAIVNARTAITLEEVGGDVKEAARLLGVSPEVVEKRAAAHSILLQAMTTPETMKIASQVDSEFQFGSLSPKQKRMIRMWLAGMTVEEMAEAMNAPRADVWRDLGRAVRRMSMGNPDWVSEGDRRTIRNVELNVDEGGAFSELTLSDGTKHRNYLTRGPLGSGASGAMGRAEVVSVQTDSGEESYVLVPTRGSKDPEFFSLFPLSSKNENLIYEAIGAESLGLLNSNSFARINGSDLMAGTLGKDSIKKLSRIGRITGRKSLLSAMATEERFGKSLLAKYENFKNALADTPLSENIGLEAEPAIRLNGIMEKISRGELATPEEILFADSVLSRVADSGRMEIRRLPHDFDEELTDYSKNAADDRIFSHYDEVSGENVRYAKRLLGMGSPNAKEFYLRIDGNGKTYKWNHPNNFKNEIGSWPDSQVGEAFMPSRDDMGAVAYDSTGVARVMLGGGESGAMSLPGQGVDYRDDDDEVVVLVEGISESSIGAAAYLAIGQNKPLSFAYYKKGKGFEKRSVMPRDLVRGVYKGYKDSSGNSQFIFHRTNAPDGHLYLRAFDPARNEQREFRLDRIASISQLSNNAQRPSAQATSQPQTGGTTGATSSQAQSSGVGAVIKSQHMLRPNVRQKLYEKKAITADMPLLNFVDEVLSEVGESDMLEGFVGDASVFATVLMDALSDPKHPLHQKANKFMLGMEQRMVQKLKELARTRSLRQTPIKGIPLRRRIKPWGGDENNPQIGKFDSWTSMDELLDWVNTGDYVLYDVETTGSPDPNASPEEVRRLTQQGRAIQIAMTPVKGGKRGTQKVWWIKPLDDEGNQVALSGWTMDNVPGPDGPGTLTDQLVMNDPRFSDPSVVGQEMADWLNSEFGDSPVLVGYNSANFDMPIAERFLSGKNMKLGWFDVMVLANNVLFAEEQSFNDLSGVQIETDSGMRPAAGTILRVAGYGKNNKINKGSRALIGTAQFEPVLDGQGRPVLNEQGKPKFKPNFRINLEKLREWAGIKLRKGAVAHSADTDAEVTHEVLKELAEHANSRGRAAHIFDANTRKELDDYLEIEWGARKQAWEDKQKQGSFNFNYSESGRTGGSGSTEGESSSSSGGRRESEKLKLPQVSIANKPSVTINAHYKDAPILLASENGRGKLILDYDFWDDDVKQRIKNQQSLLGRVAEARKKGLGMEFVYGKNEDGSPRIYEVFAVDLVPQGGMTVQEALEASETSRQIKFNLAGTTRDGRSFEFDVREIGNVSAPEPTESRYVPQHGNDVSGTSNLSFMTPDQYSDYNMRQRLISERSNADRNLRSFDSGGTSGAMSGLTNRYGGRGGPDSWKMDEKYSSFSDMDDQQLASLAEQARRSVERSLFGGRGNYVSANESLDRLRNAETALALSTGRVFDDAGFSVSKNPRGGALISGSGIVSNWRRKSSYFVPGGRKARAEINRNAQISVEFDKTMENSPKGMSLRTLARNLRMSEDELGARLESHDFTSYADAIYSSRVATIRKLFDNGSIGGNDSGLFVPDGLSVADAMFYTSRAMTILGIGSGDSGAMADGAPYGSDVSRYSEMSDEDLITWWNRTLANLFDLEVGGAAPRPEIRTTSRGRYGDKNFNARASLLKRHLEAIAAEIRRRFFDSEEGAAAVNEILNDGSDSGSMALPSGQQPLSGSRWLDSRIEEMYGSRWMDVAANIGRRFVDLEERDWSSPKDDDLVDLAHYSSMLTHDSIIDTRMSLSADTPVDATVGRVLTGVAGSIAFISQRIGLGLTETEQLVERGKRIARMRLLAAMNPYDRVEELIAARAKAIVNSLIESKKRTLSPSEFDEWYRTAIERVARSEMAGGTEIPMEGFFGEPGTEEALGEFINLFQKYDPSSFMEGGDSGAMGRNFIEPRYDIKPHQGGWVIIDTKNRNAVSSRVFSDRLEALRGAKRMDRGDRSFNPYQDPGIR